MPFQLLLRLRSSRRPELPWRPDHISQEERIAAAIVVGLMAALLYAVFAVYSLNREHMSAVETSATAPPAAHAARKVL
jgi:hypothetical protein